MDTFFDILINLSPIVLILGIYAIHKFRKEKKTYWFVLILVTIILFGMAVSIAGDGYGNLYISITILMFSVAFFVVMLCIGFYKRMYRSIIVLIMPIAYLLHSIYKRIEYKEIISIDEQTVILEIFSDIIQNEWFKGIGIGIISAVVGGVILEKIKEKK